jgi:hypothetical protein
MIMGYLRYMGDNIGISFDNTVKDKNKGILWV